MMGQEGLPSSIVAILLGVILGAMAFLGLILVLLLKA